MSFALEPLNLVALCRVHFPCGFSLPGGGLELEKTGYIKREGLLSSSQQRSALSLSESLVWSKEERLRRWA